MLILYQLYIWYHIYQDRYNINYIGNVYVFHMGGDLYMNIRQLRYFIAIAEERQITAAARKLHMTQPPLSQQLSSMEEELGVELVIRSGKFLELTDAGRALYKNALKIVGLIDESNMEIKEIGKGMRGRLEIGINTLSYHRLPSLLRAFQRKYPNISYKVQQNESGQLCKLLKDRSIELAIVRLPVELEDLSILYFKPEPFYFVISKDLKLSSKKISYEQIQEYPLIIPSTEGLGLYNMIVDQFYNRGFNANVICECSDILTLFELVSSGFGGTIIPRSILKIHKDYDMHVYEIDDDEFIASSGLIWLKERYLSKTSRNFIKLLKDKYPDDINE